MSLTNSGKCEKCGKDFFWSIGNPSWFFGNWELDLKIMFGELLTNEEKEIIKAEKAMKAWWFSVRNLCQKCAPPPPKKDGIKISIGMT